MVLALHTDLPVAYTVLTWDRCSGCSAKHNGRVLPDGYNSIHVVDQTSASDHKRASELLDQRVVACNPNERCVPIDDEGHANRYIRV